jgi:uncharacterized membrane protein YfcA
MLLGVAAGSVLFVSPASALVPVSDRCLSFGVGLIGIAFVLYQALRRRILTRLSALGTTGWKVSTVFGITAGLTSTLAHAGGPVLQMFLLPQKLPKLHFAGTTVAFFFTLNLVKMVPFTLLGRFERADLYLGAAMLPVIPLGVAAGYGLVRAMKPRHYVGFIYTVLAATSALLIIKAAGGRSQ